MKTTEKSDIWCELKFRRGDFESCPHCDDRFDRGIWKKNAVTLVTGVVNGSHGYLAVVSECPSCFEKSWAHESFTNIIYVDGWPSKWKKTARAEDKRRRLIALRDWGRGLCWRCKHLDSGEVTTHAWRVCKRGSGRVETQCSYFKDTKVGGMKKR